MPLLNNDDFEKVLSEAMPWMFDGVMSSGVDALTELANQVHPGVDPLTSDQEARMRELSSRYRRLQPIEAKTPADMQGAAIPGNVHSVDTRGIQAGAQNVLAALVNRERQRRVEGDPKAVEKHTRQAQEYRQSAEDRLGGLQTPGAEMVLDRKERRRYDRDIARAERSDQMAERYGGFADELNSYMETVAQGKATEENRQKFMEKFLPELFKAQTENVRQKGQTERTREQTASREKVATAANESRERVAKMNNQARISVAGLRGGINALESNVPSAASVGELRQYITAFSEEAEAAKKAIDRQIRELPSLPRKATEEQRQARQAEINEFEKEKAEFDKELSRLREIWYDASLRTSRSLDKDREIQDETIDFDSIFDDQEDF